LQYYFVPVKITVLMPEVPQVWIPVPVRVKKQIAQSAQPGTERDQAGFLYETKTPGGGLRSG